VKKTTGDLVPRPSSKTPQGKPAMRALADQMSNASATIDKLPPSAPVVDSAPMPEGAGHIDTWA